MSQLRAYLELFRLPNVFTAIADVAMGFLITHTISCSVAEAALLVAASALLYTAGMVLNDVYDAQIDAEERPQRPIPSGRVSLRFARWLGYELLGLGVAAGWIASWLHGNLQSGIAATLLAGAVIGYDVILKKTQLAPLGMGICRFLNVALGMSAAAVDLTTMHALVALGVGVYIVGVTWFSRSEAVESSRGSLSLATVVMMSGIAILAWFPFYNSIDGQPSPLFPHVARLGSNWWMLWVLLALSIAFRAVKAIASPSPLHVQMAVKHAIMSLIVLDAAVTFSVHGPMVATGVLALLIPAQLLGRWIYST